MSIFTRIILLPFIFSLLVSFTSGVKAQVTTVGKEFYFGFMENNAVPPDAPDRGIVLITALENARGVIEYSGRSVMFNLTAGQQFTYSFDDVDMLHRRTGQVENKSVYINSSGDVSVYAFNERFRSADGTVVLPLPTLGKDYFVTSHFERMTQPVNFNPNINNESILLVVAVENGTEISITPSALTLNGNQPGVPFTITLNKGQTYQLKARGDLTGSRVTVVGDNPEDCKNIAVFGGNKWTSVGNCGQANDHLYQQAYPVNTWGTDFIHIPFSGRSSGELVKVLASEDNTVVRVNGTTAGNISSGEFLTLNFGKDEIASIVSSKPSSVTVFSKSQECNERSDPLFNDGDPLMITYSPNQQLLTKINFNAIGLPSITSHYVNIIVKTEFANQTFLDNNFIGNSFAEVPGNSEFSYSKFRINEGVHSLVNENGFIAYVYGFGFIESYGYAVGASLDNLVFDIEGSYEFEVDGDRVACLNQEGSWEVFPENDIFTFFLWDFGDGSPSKTGKVTSHTFSEEGEYEIKIIAAVSENSCELQEEISYMVNVIGTDGEIQGMETACPLVEEVSYRLVSTSFFSKVDWDVIGGEIITEDGELNQITVRWGEANENARVLAIPYTMEGCPGDELGLDVRVNPVIQSSIPEGVDDVCFDPDQIFTYKVSDPVPNRGYEWFVENGQILGSSDEIEVEVSWHIADTVGRVWYREFSLLDDLCEGTSPVIEVTVTPLLEVFLEEKRDLLCFGDADGFIQVSVEGGKAPYTYSWSHDQILDAALADGLSAGLYNLTVTDAFGCSVMLDEIELSEPEVLSVASIETESTTCYGREDGLAYISISGGVQPYEIDFEWATIVANEITLENLAGLPQSFTVTDANGCTLPINFTVPSPEPNVVGISIAKYSCPGESNGELVISDVRGTGPFTYSWGFDNSLGASLTGIPKGIYEVSVTDSFGCISEGIGEMLEDAPQIRMPTGYDPREDFYGPVANCDFDFTMQIYNRWGNLLYSGNSNWDGKVNGEDAPLGTYTYRLSYSIPVNGEIVQRELTGYFTLIR